MRCTITSVLFPSWLTLGLPLSGVTRAAPERPV